MIGLSLRRLGLTLLFAGFLVAASVPVTAPRAYAQCINCGCNHNLHVGTRALIVAENVETRLWVMLQMQLYRDHFWINFMFKQNIAAMLMMMADQIVATGMLQIEAIGAMFDAQAQMETQRLMQQLMAQAHKDYQPDMEVCSVASVSRSLAMTFRTSEAVTHTLSKREQDRVLMTADVSSAGGLSFDKKSRYDQFRDLYCNANDQFGHMAAICDKKGPSYNTDRDINYMETVGMPKTVLADFAKNQPGTDGTHILAMASNLYGADTFNAINNQIFRDPKAHPLYLDVRSIAARRAVSEYSFNSIIGQKTGGSDAAADIAPFVKKLYAQLGYTDDDINKLVGDKPSYFALMETMNKTVFLRPEFYSNLYTSPANIDRISATIRAANVMQNMDKFDSQLRMEMNYSQILEAEVGRLQDQVQNRVNRLTANGHVIPPKK